nr:NUDIX hydrolase [Ancylobacter defluvii]
MIKLKVARGRPLEQVAALPFRVTPEGRLEVMLVSSRDTHRAVIPKGWPMKKHRDWKAAEIEARQEAGLIGAIGRKSIGDYRYWKRLQDHFALVKVVVFPLAVSRQLDEWPERHEREQRWMSPASAALLVDETDLATLITDFAMSSTWIKSAHRSSSKTPGRSRKEPSLYP